MNIAIKILINGKRMWNSMTTFMGYTTYLQLNKII